MMAEFVEQVSDTVKSIMSGMHTAIPAKVVSFDVKSCNVSVLPIMKFRKPDGETMDYPEITGVPVVIPQSMGQKATIAFPIKSGDTGLLIVAEQSLDYWMYEQDTDTQLAFDLTNSVFIPGLFNKANIVLAEAANKNAVIVDIGGTRVTVKAESVQVDAATITFNGDVTVNGNFTNNPRTKSPQIS